MVSQRIPQPRSVGEGEPRFVKMASATQEGVFYLTEENGRFCRCPARRECHHMRSRRAQRRMELDAGHRVEERRGLYGAYYVVLSSAGIQVTGPTPWPLEALGWAAEEDTMPLEVLS